MGSKIKVWRRRLHRENKQGGNALQRASHEGIKGLASVLQVKTTLRRAAVSDKLW